jgi:uncharacterized protein (DUF433 family)
MPARQLDINELWEFTDPRDMPAYTVADAAHYLTIPVATLRSWVRGRAYTLSKGVRKNFPRVIELPHPKSPLLSFYNLAEAHVLRGLRTGHQVPLPHIRRALKFVSQAMGWKRPLIQQGFMTDGVRLFVERLGKLLDASADGQVVMREVVEAHLSRLEWENQLVARLYPFTRENDFEAAPKSVLIDPRYSFGRPILRESRIATSLIAERYKAGESVEELANDYGCSGLEIEEAIRCELKLPIAA